MENVERIDDNRVRIVNDYGINITLFANQEVFLDRRSVDEIISFASIKNTIEQLAKERFFGDVPADVKNIVLTPDFHRGAGIPVGTVFESHGFVLPKAVGSDIGCGMRLLATDVTADEFNKLGKDFENHLRYIFFEGGRNIPLSAAQRRAVFSNGIQGLYSNNHSSEGIWKYWDKDQQLADIMRTHKLGSFEANNEFSFDDFITGNGSEFTRDDQIGSIGGGNHFVEIQRVDEIIDSRTAYAWNLKRNYITVMAHSGSVGIGHIVGNHFTDLAKRIFPTNVNHPSHGFYMLPTDGEHSEDATKYINAMFNAANFASTNRLFLGLMAIRALSEMLNRRIEAKLVYDAPHNLIWSQDQHTHLHRKGACPAGLDQGDSEFPDGHPVLIPGSMGDSSYVLKGHGNTTSFCSACHGAGRLAPRQGSRNADPVELERLRIVTKVDPQSHAFRTRPDLLREYQKVMMEEAPSAYKEITPVINTVVGAEIASKVARLWPLMTIKG